MPVLINSEIPGRLPVSVDYLTKVAETMLALGPFPEAELSILLVNDTRMAGLNATYRNKNKPTNVLSFPMMNEDTPPDELLGDIVISLETSAREAKEKNITLHRRLNELLVHGFVHLIGYDHELSDEEARIMEEIEQKMLEVLYEQRRNTMIQLAVNVDHVATLRQARGINEPDPVHAAGICELAGASGIVIHLREDRRHIQDRDVYLMRQMVKTKLNLEMGATKEIIDIALDVKPDMVTLVPEKRAELTTEGGLNVAGQSKKLTKVVKKFNAAGIPVSMFIDPDAKQIKASRDVGATFVEIHTGRYSDALTEEEEEREFDLVATAAEEAYEIGLRVNAGHGLNYRNTAPIAALGIFEELSIGHAVMARAIFVGIDQAVKEMLDIMKG